jgi:hypothetical protein
MEARVRPCARDDGPPTQTRLSVHMLKDWIIQSRFKRPDRPKKAKAGSGSAPKRPVGRIPHERSAARVTIESFRSHHRCLAATFLLLRSSRVVGLSSSSS